MQTNKRAVESFIVAKNGTTLKTTGTLNNNSTGAVNLADGQIGLASVSAEGSVLPYNFLAASPTIDQSPIVSIFQGTASSANPAQAQAQSRYPLSARPYEQSGSINFRNTVTVTKQPVLAPTLSAWVIGSVAAPIVVADETNYNIKVAFGGRRIQEFYSIEQAYAISENVLTPNYTALATAEPADHMLQNMVWLLNRNSYATAIPGRKPGKAPMAALLLSTAGGTAISAITVGSFLPLVSSAYGVRGITVTAEQLAAIQAMGTASSMTNVLTVDLATAGTVTGGVGEAIGLLGLDETTAYIDTIPQIKVRLDVGLAAGFASTVNKTKVSNAFEGQGQPRPLAIMYRNTAGQRKYEQVHEQFPVIEYGNPVDLTVAGYVTYTILHGKLDHVDTGNVLWHPRKELILVDALNTTLVTALDTALNSLLSTGDNQAIVTAD